MSDCKICEKCDGLGVIYFAGGERGEASEPEPCECQAKPESNMLSLSDKPLDENLVNSEIIKLLEEALEMAKKGEISSLSITFLLPNGMLKNRAISSGDQSFALLGGMVLAQRDFASAWKKDG